MNTSLSTPKERAIAERLIKAGLAIFKANPPHIDSGADEECGWVAFDGLSIYQHKMIDDNENPYTVHAETDDDVVEIGCYKTLSEALWVAFNKIFEDRLDSVFYEEALAIELEELDVLTRARTR